MGAITAQGVQAAWRLCRWDLLENFVSDQAQPGFDVGLGRCLLAVHKDDIPVGWSSYLQTSFVLMCDVERD